MTDFKFQFPSKVHRKHSREYFYFYSEFNFSKPLFFSLGTVHPLMIDDKMWDRFSFVKRDDPGPGRVHRPATCGMGTAGYLLQKITITCNDTLLFISPEDPFTQKVHIYVMERERVQKNPHLISYDLLSPILSFLKHNPICNVL